MNQSVQKLIRQLRSPFTERQWLRRSSISITFRRLVPSITLIPLADAPRCRIDIDPHQRFGEVGLAGELNRAFHPQSRAHRGGEAMGESPLGLDISARVELVSPFPGGHFADESGVSRREQRDMEIVADIIWRIDPRNPVVPPGTDGVSEEAGSSRGPNGLGMTNLPQCRQNSQWRATSAVRPFDSPYGENAKRCVFVGIDKNRRARRLARDRLRPISHLIIALVAASVDRQKLAAVLAFADDRPRNRARQGRDAYWRQRRYGR
jgi:hypothetical protein